MRTKADVRQRLCAACSTQERFKQRLLDAAGMPLLVPQNIEGAPRQFEPDAVQGFGGERGCNNEIGDRGRRVAGFYRGTDRLVGGQLQRDPKIGQFDAGLPKR